MKLLEKARVETLYKQDNIVIPCEKGQIEELLSVLDFSFDKDKDYEVIIKPKSKKRSLDANAYMWTLIKKLSAKYGISHIETYKVFIQSVGVYEVLPIKDEAVNRYIKVWSDNGIGWFCEVIGKSKFEGYTNIKAYYGSSSYDSKEMARLIDEVVSACKDENIETLTPSEIERLKQLW